MIRMCHLRVTIETVVFHRSNMLSRNTAGHAIINGSCVAVFMALHSIPRGAHLATHLHLKRLCVYAVLNWDQRQNSPLPSIAKVLNVLKIDLNSLCILNGAPHHLD